MVRHALRKDSEPMGAMKSIWKQRRRHGDIKFYEVESTTFN